MAHEVWQGEGGLFYYHIQAANGEIVSASEGYTRQADAERGYQALLRAVQEDVLKLPSYVLMTKGTELGFRVVNDAFVFSDPQEAIRRAYQIVIDQGLEVAHEPEDALTKLEAGDTIVLVDIDGEGDVIILKRTMQEE